MGLRERFWNVSASSILAKGKFKAELGSSVGGMNGFRRVRSLD